MGNKLFSVSLTILASIGASLSITTSSLWFLAPISLGLFFYVLLFKTSKRSTSIINGIIFGLATGGAGIWWFWHALPVDWIAPTSVFTQFAAVFITWLLVTLALAVPTVIFSYIIWRLREHNFIALFLIFGWTLQEFGRELSFAILTVAQESSFAPHFSPANIGYTLANNNYLLQLAEGGGVYNLSIVVGLIATIIAFVAHSTTQKKSKVLIVVLLVILLIPSFARETEKTKMISFTILSSNIPTSSGIDTSIIYRRKIEEIAKREVYPDVIILPEGGGLTTMRPEGDQKEMLQELFGEHDVLIISSDYIKNERGGKYSKLSYDSNIYGKLGEYKKIFLMPQGEYTPRIISLTFPILQNGYVNRYIKSLSLMKGSELKSVEHKGVQIGGLLCSESLSPRLYRKLVKEHGADILVNLSRTSWFHGSQMLHNKTIEIAKVHSVQNRAYYLQATNGAPSFVINSNGELIAETKWDKMDMIDIDIPVEKD